MFLHFCILHIRTNVWENKASIFFLRTARMCDHNKCSLCLSFSYLQPMQNYNRIEFTCATSLSDDFGPIRAFAIFQNYFLGFFNSVLANHTDPAQINSSLLNRTVATSTINCSVSYSFCFCFIYRFLSSHRFSFVPSRFFFFAYSDFYSISEKLPI